MFRTYTRHNDQHGKCKFVLAIMEKYGNLLINQDFRKMDALVWKLIKEYIIG